MKSMVFAAALFVTQTLAAQEVKWNLDKSHSSVMFTVTHMVVSEVTGRFGDYSIDFKSSRDDFSDAAVKVVIKTASINTDNTSRDDELRSAAFFKVEQFPEITFVSDAFEKIEGNRYKIRGELTVRDVTKQVAFDAEYRGSVKTQRGIVAAWKASLEIDRFEYGLKWDRMIDSGNLVVGKTVRIQVTLEMRGQQTES